ncbi:MAG: DNA adenine methylase [Planctomycetes bacterium]|nr:DNA adenine methylase [Planctomycetota bacterium]
MGYTRSPLRYPGGKSRLSIFIRSLMKANDLLGGTYIEPFAGGAGVAWALLFDGSASHVYLNDLDPAIFAFWNCVLKRTEELCRTIRDTPVNMRVWRRQRQVLDNASRHSQVELGFAAFFLNRTNRSGIIRAGVIGGKQQSGRWKLDARFNKPDLISRIQRIAGYANRVSLWNRDAAKFLVDILPQAPKKSLVFLDPPYYHRGMDLYHNHYKPKDHTYLARIINNRVSRPWVVSYDNVAEIRQLYCKHTQRTYHLTYSVADRYSGSEVLVASQGLILPRISLPKRRPNTRGVP